MNPDQQQGNQALLEQATDELRNRARRMQGRVSANDLVNPTPRVNVPEPVQPEPVGNDALLRNVQNNLTFEIDDFGQNQAERQRLLEEQRALSGEGSLSDLFNQQQEEFQIPQNLRQLQDIQLQLADLGTESLQTRSDIARAAGQTTGQGSREISAEQARNNVRSYGLAAQAAVLQGNIQTAQAAIQQAMNIAYQDRQLRNTNLINQINAVQAVVSEQRSEILEQEKRRYEEDQINIGRAVNSVNAAMVTGLATSADIETMTSLSDNPTAQKEYADKIIARAARQEYNMRIAAVNAARNAAAANAVNEQQAQAQANAVSTQAAVDTISDIRNNPLGIKAITGSFGLGRTSISAGFESGATQGFIGGTLAGAAAGSIIPGVGTVLGGAAGGVAGFLGGLGLGSSAAAGQRTNVASDLGYLVNEATFSEMRRLRAQGVTFGSLTEGERVAIGRAADNLFSSLDVSPDGTVNGVNVTEEKFYNLLNDYEQKRLVYQEELNRMASGMSEDDYQAIENAGQ